jgi:DNA-binding response OmpR family regulator
MTILDVGQCGFDGPRMARLWRERLQAKVINAGTGEEAGAKLKEGEVDIVLVNRVLASDGSSGLDLIPDLLEANAKVPVMLVSDIEEAQVEAVRLGAVRGFGKSELESDETLDLVEQAARR